MANGTIAIDEPTTVDKQLDTTQLTVAATTVQRERVVIAGASDVDLAPVDATLGLTVDPADRSLRDLGKVDIAGFDVSLPAGTNAIGKLAANSGVDIGDVDVTSLPALAAGTNNIGDVDVLTVPAPLSTTGGGTEATALRVTLASDSTGVVSVDDNGGSLTVDGTVAATQSGTWNVGTVTTVTTVSAVTAISNALPAGTNNIGDVDVASAVATDFEHGSNLDVDTAAEQLPNQTAKFGVTVKAARANTGLIYVGKSDVTAGTTDATDGFELGAGESLFLPVSNANLIYVIGSANNQKIFWVAA